MTQQLHDNKITALYCRLSRDDGYADDSCSIDSQKSMLKEYALNQGFERCEFFVDDGYSGTNFNRPDFSRMIEMVELNTVSTVVVKDLSRLGREYLQTGYYSEIFFPMHDVRFIAINDGVDTANGENEFAPFKNLLNEMYAKDISRKIKSSKRIRAKRGEYMNGNPPYGYMRDPENRNHLIPDKNTAPMVRMMYDLAAEGKTAYAISIILKDKQVPKPTAYVLKNDGSYDINKKFEYPYEWCAKTVRDILSNVTYIGHLYFGMTSHRSFKDKTKVRIPEEQWVKCENNHEPLIDEDLFNKVQEFNKASHRVIRFSPEANIYKALCYCADCGFVMYFGARPGRQTAGYYSCGRSRLKPYRRGCTAHYITIEEINDIFLREFRIIASKVKSDKKAFVKDLIRDAENELEKANAKVRKELDRATARVDEINILIRSLYEDRVFGRITEEAYSKLSANYDKELARLTEKIPELNASLLTRRTSDDAIRQFADLVEKHADITTMTTEISHELIDHILVHERGDKRRTNGKRLEIFFRFVGKVNIRRRN